MTTYYANAQTGDDTNSGLTEALAKKTLAGAYAVTVSGDTTYISGVFNELLPHASEGRIWRSKGYAELDGQDIIGPDTAAGGFRLVGVTVRRFVDYAIRIRNSTEPVTFDDCIFCDQPVGIRETVSDLPKPLITNCQFLNHSTAAIQQGASKPILRRCSFSGNAIGFWSDVNSTSYKYNIKNCAFADTVHIQRDFAISNITFCEENAFDFTNGECIEAGVSKTSLAAWQTATGADANSHDRNMQTDMCDPLKMAVRSTPSSFLLTADIGGEPIGVTKPSVTLSNNRNASLWTGGVFTNCEIDGSGNLVLSAGQTLGTYKTDVIDFGANIDAHSVEIYAAGSDRPNTYVDYDTADSPNHVNIRVRGSATAFVKTDVSPAWVIVPIGSEIGAYMSSGLRYWQIELTLRA